VLVLSRVLLDELNAFATSDLAMGLLFSELLCIVFFEVFD